MECILGLCFISALTNQMLDDYPIKWVLGLYYISALTNQMLDDCPLGLLVGLGFCLRSNRLNIIIFQ